MLSCTSHAHIPIVHNKPCKFDIKLIFTSRQIQFVSESADKPDRCPGRCRARLLTRDPDSVKITMRCCSVFCQGADRHYNVAVVDDYEADKSAYCRVHAKCFKE